VSFEMFPLFGTGEGTNGKENAKALPWSNMDRL
jgi:hypothetical protein